MSNYHLMSDATPLSQVNKLELGLRQLRKTVERKLGKKEDPSIVKGDSELDSKLTNFETIEESVYQLMTASRTLHISSRACANQDIVTGRFLIDSNSGEEGSVRLATNRMGEVYKECGIETNSLKSFSDRVQEELSVFYTKGIGDLREEIEIMEESRTDYRAALSWLRATSVDPDKLGQIEKFRRVQQEVKTSKERFDVMKTAIQAKIDLLRVSRASLLSNAMGPLYQHEREVSAKMAELFDEAADGIVASTSADFDFKILKELRSDYQGDENEIENDNQAQNTQEQKDQEQLIKDDMLLLDIDDIDTGDLELGELSLADKNDDLFPGDLMSLEDNRDDPVKGHFERDLFDIFESQANPSNQQNDPC